MEPESTIEFYLSKDEVDNLLISFQTSLQELQSEISKYQSDIKALQSDLLSETHSKKQKDQDLSNINLSYQEASITSELLSEHTKLYKQVADMSQESKEFTLQSLTQELDSKTHLERTSLIADMISEAKSLHDEYNALRETNKNLSQECTFLENESFRLKECRRCRSKFISTKYALDCVFHPGQLKFYSCRKCGNSNYYTCCNYCKDCSVGCKTSHHIS